MTTLLVLLLGNIVFPREIDTPLHNPLKGWTLIEHAIPGHTDLGESFRLIDDNTPFEWFQNVALMSTWAQVEREPDKFDWSLLDYELDYWYSRGKTIHLRFSLEDFGNIRGCPEWLYAMGVPYQERDAQHFPDYTHPHFRKRASAFLECFFAKYGKDPRVETIDLRGYGNWGEWHSGYYYDSPETRIHALRSIIDLWRKTNHTQKPLMLSASYEWQTRQNSGVQCLPLGTSIYEPYKPSYSEFLHRSAFDYAFSFPDICARRDGVGGAVFQEYDGRLIANLFQHYRKPICGEFFGPLAAYRGPSIVGFPNTKEGDDFVVNAIDEALSHRINYCTALGWTGKHAAEFYNRYRDLIIYAHMKMGYRFVLTRVEYPDNVAPGEAFTIKHVWENRGVGRCYRPFRVTFFVIGSDGTVWSTTDSRIDITNVVSGQTYNLTTSVTLPEEIPEGMYDLRVGLTNDFGRPVVELAIAGNDRRRRYNLGQIEVKKDSSPPPVGLSITPTQQADMWMVKDKILPDRHYLLSFSYRVLAVPSHDLNTDDPGYFTVFAENTAHSRVAETRWFDRETGKIGHKTVLVNAEYGEEPYTLFWQSSKGGVIEIQDVVLEEIPTEKVFRLSVSNGDLELLGNATLREGNRIRAARERPEVTLPDDWYPIVQTNLERVTLEKGAVYTVWFYCSARPQIWQGDYFYLAIREKEEKGSPPKRVPSRFFSWTQRHTNSPVRQAYTFRTVDEGKTFLEWGIKNGGECEVFDVIVHRHN